MRTRALEPKGESGLVHIEPTIGIGTASQRQFQQKNSFGVLPGSLKRLPKSGCAAARRETEREETERWRPAVEGSCGRSQAVERLRTG